MGQSAWVIQKVSELRAGRAVLNCLALICAASAFLWTGCASEKQKPESPWDIEMKHAQDALGRNDRAEANRFLLASLRLAEEEKDDQHLSASLGNLALLRYSEAKYPEAEQFCSRQLEIDRERLGTNNMTLADELARFAELEEMLKKYARAEDLYSQAQQVVVDIRGPSTPLAGIYLAKRAHLLSLQGKKTQAQQFYKRAVNFLDDSQFDLSLENNLLGKQRHIVDELARIRSEYAEFCEQDGRLEEAALVLERAIHSLELIHGKGCAQATEMFESLDRIQKQLEAKAALKN
jgi:hypothetical protein